MYIGGSKNKIFELSFCEADRISERARQIIKHYLLVFKPQNKNKTIVNQLLHSALESVCIFWFLICEIVFVCLWS